ncbi:MAG: hypothetical protein LBD48_05085 [Treponema sp.]|jgi:hypothetical protein|nr:hypothetical protein [Treponema sp.]
MKHVLIICAVVFFALGGTYRAAAQTEEVTTENNSIEQNTTQMQMQTQMQTQVNPGTTDGKPAGQTPQKAAPEARIITVVLDGVMDAFYLRSMNGDYASKTPEVNSSPFYYQGEGDINVFKPSSFDDPLNARAVLALETGQFGGLLQIRAPLDTGFASNWDWKAWVRPLDFLRLEVGNQAQRTSVANYQNFDDFLRTKIDHFGVMLPLWVITTSQGAGNTIDTAAGFPWGYAVINSPHGRAVFSGTDHTDLSLPSGASARAPIGFTLEGLAQPLAITAFVGGLFDHNSRPFDTIKDAIGIGGGSTFSGHDRIHDPFVISGVNFGVRAEGRKIAIPALGDLTAAAVYKYAATALNKETAAVDANFIDEKIGNHSFGVYLNLPVDAVGLGVSLGYSAYLQTWQNSKYEKSGVDSTALGNNDHVFSAYKETRMPLYSGIDLRLAFTPPRMNKLSFTFNNNVSFAGMTGTVNQKLLYSKSWVYETQLNEDTIPGVEKRQENYVGVYSALGVKYALTEKCTADLQVGNQLGLFMLKWENDPLLSLSNYLGAYAGSVLTVYKSSLATAALRAGLSMKMSSYVYQNPAPTLGYPEHKAGLVEFGIPVGIRVEF